MTVQKARTVFATHMQAARTRSLTSYEKNQLAEARQVLRHSRKPSMNPEGKKDRYTGWINGDRVTTGYTITETVQRIYDILKSDKGVIYEEEPFIDIQVRAKFEGKEQIVHHASVKRSSKAKPNPIRNASYAHLLKQQITTGDRVYYRTDRKQHGTVRRAVPRSDQYWINWDDGDYTVVRRSEIRRLLAGPKGKLPNPKEPGVLIYQHVDRIYATKGPGHLCDAECAKNGHRYFHDFKTRPKMYGLPDGSILIKS